MNRIASALVTAGVAFVLAMTGESAAQSLLTGPSGLYGSWRVAALDAQALPPGSDATLIFGNGVVSGKSFCNRYNAKIDIAPYTMEVGTIASTRMACPPPAMAQEQTFLAILRQARTALILGTTLTLNAADGRTIRFRRMSN